jgi:hypothetical protein
MRSLSPAEQATAARPPRGLRLSVSPAVWKSHAALTATELIAAVAQLAAGLTVGWAVGDLAIRRALQSRTRSAGGVGLGLPERGLAAAFGLVAFSVALMVGHMATGGAVFRLPWVVPAAGVAAVTTGALLGSWPRRMPWARVGAAAVVLGALYATPAVIGGSSLRSGDTPWHMGRTNHLLGGEIVPGGPAARFDRNAYPWGVHAVLATLVRLVPGSDVATAMSALCWLTLLALPLGAASLARLVERGAGWPAAACACLVGGFGWIQAGGPAFFTSPQQARFGADLVTASPNGAYALFPPALPRELGLVLLCLGGLLVAIAACHGDGRAALAAGAAFGVMGLVSVPMLLNGLTWAIAGVFASFPRRPWLLVRVLVTAAVVFSLWALPVAVNYVRYDGFVNVAPVLGREWALPTALASWGLLGPFSLAGLGMAATRGGAAARPLLGFAGAAIVMFVLAVARGAMDWELGGIPWLLHQGRMWPPAHVLASAFAGIFLFLAYRWLRERARRWAIVAPGVLAIVCVISLVFASISLTNTIAHARGGFIYTGRDFDTDGFVRRAARLLDPHDVVETRGSRTLDLYLFQYSGVRIANFEDQRLESNDARIRYRELARRWDHAVASGGFQPDFVALPARAAPPGSEVLARGPFEGRLFVLIRARR